jgi:hypothetical protein
MKNKNKSLTGDVTRPRTVEVVFDLGRGNANVYLGAGENPTEEQLKHALLSAFADSIAENGLGMEPSDIDGPITIEYDDAPYGLEMPCYFCGTQLTHVDEGGDGWIALDSSRESGGQDVLYCNGGCPVDGGVGPGPSDKQVGQVRLPPRVWRCTCESDFIENVGPECALCGAEANVAEMDYRLWSQGWSNPEADAIVVRIEASAVVTIDVDEMARVMGWRRLPQILWGLWQGAHGDTDPLELIDGVEVLELIERKGGE